jgi:hypothetical protein
MLLSYVGWASVFLRASPIMPIQRDAHDRAICPPYMTGQRHQRWLVWQLHRTPSTRSNGKNASHKNRAVFITFNQYRLNRNRPTQWQNDSATAVI